MSIVLLIALSLGVFTALTFLVLAEGKKRNFPILRRVHEPPANYIRQRARVGSTQGSTTMLAEIFMLRLEAQMRASEDPISSPFAPIELLAPENPDEIVED
jgi:hypothetical protein